MENQKILITDIAAGLKSSDFKVRKNSVLFLARVDKPEVIDLLLPLLNDPSDEIRTHCKKIIDFLTQKYSNSNELISKQEKLKIKQEFADSSFSPEKLLQLILVNDPKIKIASIMSFYGIKNEHVLITFKKFLQIETDETVIATYIKAIGSIGGSEEIQFLKKYLSHFDNRVKSNTIEALSELGSYEEIIDDILPMTESNEERLKLTAKQYLSRIDVDVLLCEFERILSTGTLDQKNAAIKISMLHTLDKTMDFYKNNWNLFSSEQKDSIIKHLHQCNSNEANILLSSFGALSQEENINSSSTSTSINDKFIFEIENELKKADEFYYQFGLKLLQAKQFTEAINEFNNAIKINPKYFKAWRERGKAFASIRNHDSAIDCFDKALALAPDDIDTWECKKNTLIEIFDDNAANICTKKIKYLKNISRVSLSENPENINNSSKIINTKTCAKNPINTNKSLSNTSSSNLIESEATKTCPRCQKINAISKNNCSKCGYKFACSEQSYNHNCAECGFNFDKKLITCPECGCEISAENKPTSFNNKPKVVSTAITNNKTRICPECGLELNANLNTCPECGYEISAENKPTSFNNKPKVVSTAIANNKTGICPECGLELNANLNTCPECGYEISAENKPTSFNNKPKVVSTAIANNKTKICPECGLELNANLNTCLECGYEFNKLPKSSHKKCPECNELGIFGEICKNCGYQL